MNILHMGWANPVVHRTLALIDEALEQRRLPPLSQRDVTVEDLLGCSCAELEERLGPIATMKLITSFRYALTT